MGKLLGVLAMCMVVAVAATVQLWRQVEQERAQRSVAEARVAQLSQEIAALKRRESAAPIKAVAAPLPVQPEPRVRSEAAPRPPVAVAPPLAPDFARMRERTQQLLRDPEYRDAMRTQHVFGLQQTYADAGRVLDLSQAELDALFGLLADQQLEHSLNTPMDAGSREQWQEKWAEQQRREEAQLSELLGPKTQAWKDYQQSMPARMQVRELQSALANSAEPLRQDQVESLVSLFSLEQQRAMQQMKAQTGARLGPALMAMPAAGVQHRVEHMQREHEALRAGAVSVLSPQQLRQFEQMLQRREAMMRAQAKMLEATMQERAVGSANGQLRTAPGLAVPLSE